MRRHVADEAVVAVVPPHPALQLNAAEQKIVVDGADQTGAFGEFEILLRADKISAMILDARIGFVIFDTARRQRDNRLQEQADPDALQGIARYGEDILRIAAERLRRRETLF